MAKASAHRWEFQARFRRLWDAYEDDQIPYIEQLGDSWGWGGYRSKPAPDVSTTEATLGAMNGASFGQPLAGWSKDAAGMIAAAIPNWRGRPSSKLNARRYF